MCWNWDWNAFGAIGTWAGAGVAFVFYRQLVANDNAREKRASDEQIKTHMKNRLAPVSGAGGMQKVIQSLLAEFPGRHELLIQAYEEYVATRIAAELPVMVKVRDFTDLVREMQ